MLTFFIHCNIEQIQPDPHSHFSFNEIYNRYSPTHAHIAYSMKYDSYHCNPGLYINLKLGTKPGSKRFESYREQILFFVAGVNILIGLLFALSFISQMFVST